MKTRNPQCQGFQTTFLQQTDMMFLSFVMAGTFEVPHRHGVRDTSGWRLRIEERARIYEMCSHDSMVAANASLVCGLAEGLGLGHDDSWSGLNASMRRVEHWSAPGGGMGRTSRGSWKGGKCDDHALTAYASSSLSGVTTSTPPWLMVALISFSVSSMRCAWRQRCLCLARLRDRCEVVEVRRPRIPRHFPIFLLQPPNWSAPPLLRRVRVMISHGARSGRPSESHLS